MKHTTIIVAVGLALTAALPAVSAQAQNLRSFVSGHGSDSNNCTLATPCRTFQAAFNVTNAGGEIAVLDSAGYGTLTINKAISIVNPGGVEGGIIVPSGGTGVVINAGASDAISLRGLTIDGGGVGQSGIQFNTGKSLTVENCVIRHMQYTTGVPSTGVGIYFAPNATSSLSVSNTLVADNGQSGIYVYPTSGSGAVTAVFNRVEVYNNSSRGIMINATNRTTDTIQATAADSIAAGNTETGFYIYTASGYAPTTLTLVRSVSANNWVGVHSHGTGGIVRLANSTVTGNGSLGWDVETGGVVQSYGDNYIDGNGSNVGSLTPIPKQ